MTIVLVHGNPETDAIWRPMLEELGRDDVICLSPPGFGASVPDRFGASGIDYRDWLIGELEEIGHPVHLVGHDLGGGHVVNAAMVRPDLVLSWAVDSLGVYDPDHVWHDLGQQWRTIDVGEEAILQWLGGTEVERVQVNLAMGIPEDVARDLAAAQDQTMLRCVLALYRSWPEAVLRELGVNLPDLSGIPGLVVIAAGDPFVGTDQMRRRMAERAGARAVELPLGHWWMLDDPTLAAKTLADFWRFVADADAQG